MRVGTEKRKFCTAGSRPHYSEDEINFVGSPMSVWFLIVAEWLTIIIGTVLAEYALRRQIRD